jgi:hypothetical protein
MATPKIVRTVVTPDGEHTAVEIHIHDATLPDASPENAITLSIRVGAYESPLLAEIQHQAIIEAVEILQQVGAAVRETIRKSNRTPGAPRPAV